MDQSPEHRFSAESRETYRKFIDTINSVAIKLFPSSSDEPLDDGLINLRYRACPHVHQWAFDALHNF